ncbi:hypothetical protein ACFL6G_05115 [candidate division KSB1 bacterium]
MQLLFYLSIVLGIFGIVLLLFPRAIIKLNEIGDKVVFTDSALFSRPKLSGVAFIILGAFLIYVGILIRDNREYFSSLF